MPALVEDHKVEVQDGIASVAIMIPQLRVQHRAMQRNVSGRVREAMAPHNVKAAIVVAHICIQVQDRSAVVQTGGEQSSL
jgi:hypothetical protein